MYLCTLQSTVQEGSLLSITSQAFFKMAFLTNVNTILIRVLISISLLLVMLSIFSCAKLQSDGIPQRNIHFYIWPIFFVCGGGVCIFNSELHKLLAWFGDEFLVGISL